MDQEFFDNKRDAARIGSGESRLNSTLSETAMDEEFFQRDVSVAKLNGTGDTDNTGSTGSTNNNEQEPLEAVILENAKGPKKVQSDAGSVEQHSLQDIIAAEKFLQSKKAAKSSPLRLIKISPDGTV